MPRHLSAVPPPDSPSGRLQRAYNSADLHDAIAAVEELRADLDSQQLQLVIRARQGGTTWETIGTAIGTTRQGAFNRFGALVQRYERAGLLDGVSDDADLVLGADDAGALSAAIVEQAGRGKAQPAVEGPVLGSVSPAAK